jgi:hypothetical protein
MEIILISVVVTLIVIAVIRELVTWYFKINRIVSQNDEIIRLLEVIAYEQEDEPKDEPELEIVETKNDEKKAIYSRRI